MTCPVCSTPDVSVLVSHGFGGAETVHDLSCGHNVTMSEVRAADAAREATPVEETASGESPSGVPEGAAVDSQEGGRVAEGGGSDPGVADAQVQPDGQEGEPGPTESEVTPPPADDAHVAPGASLFSDPETVAPTEPAAESTPEHSLLQTVEGEIEHFLHPGPDEVS